MAKKTVLITGCSDGSIGSTLAKQFVTKGYHVFATLRNTSKAASLAGMNDIEVLELEVTSRDSITACIAEVHKRNYGALDILINSAGADFVCPFLDVDIDEAKRLYDVNVWSIMLVTQAFAPLLIKAQGCVANLGSIAGEMPLCWSSVYVSSKAAAKQMSEVMRTELAPLGVRVITAIVGAVNTPIHQRAGELDLPVGSYYTNIRSQVNEVRKGTHKPGAVETDVVARELIDDIIGGKNGVTWRGGTATVVKYLSWLLPRGLWESVVNKGRGLEEVVKQDGKGENL
ncbi:putative short-chain dehydrogenase/reductase [Xylaria bambusicola]|uniref:putative short-chain dehydrogenase/reductase n=1 Tax=Xylaria bambusicola TaxID=326684 RepID=UPI0020079660|nr:putative short-chain dehydrogenase/reductase [Xylaria bambusicola]KAI0522145.1 putative short-chain dehydrogenase/reductase [Xylaria bambusicola]